MFGNKHDCPTGLSQKGSISEYSWDRLGAEAISLTSSFLREVQRNPHGLPNVIFTISKSLPVLKDAEQVRELLYESDQKISGHQEEAPSSQHTPITDGDSVKK